MSRMHQLENAPCLLPVVRCLGPHVSCAELQLQLQLQPAATQPQVQVHQPQEIAPTTSGEQHQRTSAVPRREYHVQVAELERQLARKDALLRASRAETERIRIGAQRLMATEPPPDRSQWPTFCTQLQRLLRPSLSGAASTTSDQPIQQPLDHAAQTTVMMPVHSAALPPIATAVRSANEHTPPIASAARRTDDRSTVLPALALTVSANVVERQKRSKEAQHLRDRVRRMQRLGAVTMPFPP
jgi:hypothetical protein